MGSIGIPPVRLATSGVTLGSGSRAVSVGSAGVRFRENPYVSVLTSGQTPSFQTGIAGRRLDARALQGLSSVAPQDFGDFVKLCGTTDSKLGVGHFVGQNVFEALALSWDENTLRTAKEQMIHSFWIYSSYLAIVEDTMLALKAFEDVNPGRGVGAPLHDLVKVTHDSWLANEKAQSYYTPFDQGVHDMVTWLAMNDLITTPLSVHQNPGKKFKLDINSYKLGPDGFTPEMHERFRTATGKELLSSGWKINTVAGEWNDLLAIHHDDAEADARWQAGRRDFLFSLQSASVASVLYGLKNRVILDSLSEGTVADRLQSLIELMRIINAAWRVNNPWGGLNSPLLAKPFALEEDGGIGIGDILRDAVVMRGVLEMLDKKLREGSVVMPDEIRVGLTGAFDKGLQQVLDVAVDEEALAAAVKINTGIYNSN